ncbi:unnamed protein product, partial [Cylindrotheca closterium]
MGVSQQERALERFLFGIYSRIHRYFERLVRSGTSAEEKLPDLGTYMETCYHGGSLPESNLFVVAKDSVGLGGTGDKTESQLKREKVLSQAVLRPYSRRRRLLQSLGPWSDSLDRWTWLFSRTALILFHRTDNNLAIYRPINSRSHKTFRRDLHHTWTGTLPGDVQRASVNLHPRTAYVTVTGTAPVDPPDPESLPASILHIWRELAADMDDDWGWVPEYIYIERDEQVLLEALEKGKLRVISDGSFKQQVGTAAVQLQTRRGGHVIWIKCRTPGKREDQIPCQAVRVACDGIAALCQAFSTWPLSPTAPHFDLLSSIREALRVSNISWAEQQVGGHADRTKTWRQMSWWERRNLEVDDIAQGYADELIATDDTIATNPKFFSKPCAIYIDNEKVSCLALESVDKAVILPELMEYWAAKGRLAPEHFQSVDWPIVHRAMKSLKPAEQRFITKHTVGVRTKQNVLY